MNEVYISDLIQRVARKDPSALRALYDCYSPLVYSLALRIVRNPWDAEELLQDTFLTLWRQALHYDVTRGSFIAWLLTITRTRAIDRLRAHNSRSRASAQAVDSRPDLPPFDAGYAEEGFLAKERADTIRRALASLPQAQRSAIELAYFEGLSQSEISERLGEPLGTVKTRVRLGISKLKESLSPYFRQDNPEA